ncbi:tail fiber domain-containing protein [Cereibacter sphaeroides]|nr:tail fiber domain-containing protein [Cereibacter sphaeroides]
MGRITRRDLPECVLLALLQYAHRVERPPGVGNTPRAAGDLRLRLRVSGPRPGERAGFGPQHRGAGHGPEARFQVLRVPTRRGGRWGRRHSVRHVARTMPLVGRDCLMGKGGGSAPKPDPQIGKAALETAETGRRYLAWMQDQAKVTNEWAAEDRDRQQSVFVPLEDQYIAEAKAYDSPERRQAAVAQAVADVRQQSALARGQQQRQLSAMGVNPSSGRFASEARKTATSEALAAAGASNTARRQVEATAEGKMANAINLGKGLAVNPATSMQISNGAASSGFQGAMQGTQAQGSMLNQQYQNQLSAYNAQQQSAAGFGQAIGMLGGAWLMSSSEEVKENKRPVHGVLDAVKELRVEKWQYKPGEGDGGEHIGPYAEEFTAKTGLGNGKEISIIDALGINMGATKELAGQVEELAAKVDSIAGAKGKPKTREAVDA